MFKISGGSWNIDYNDLDLKLSRAEMEYIADYLKRAILQEAEKDRKDLRQLPKSKNLDNSWEIILTEDGIFLQSDWEWIDMYVEGMPEQPMTWLTQDKGVYLVPLISDTGEVHIRTAPMKTSDAWIHPGVARHTFVDRALERTYDEILGIMWERTFRELQRAAKKTKTKRKIK